MCPEIDAFVVQALEVAVHVVAHEQDLWTGLCLPCRGRRIVGWGLQAEVLSQSFYIQDNAIGALSLSRVSDSHVVVLSDQLRVRQLYICLYRVMGGARSLRISALKKVPQT